MKFIITLFLFIVIAFSGCKNSKNENKEIPKKIQREEITGRIYVVGNEPFTRLALSVNDSASYFLSSSDSIMKEISMQQGNEVSIVIDSLKKNQEGVTLYFSKYIQKKE